MGNLRARSDDEKARKKKAILDAAWALLQTKDGNLPTAIEIANFAGISKGTVYVYFQTKEEIYLGLFLEKLQEWAADVGTELARCEKADIRTAALALARYPSENPLLMQLGGLLHGVLEKNAPFEALLSMKLQVAELVEDAGALLHRHLPWLPPEGGARLMLSAYTLFSGLYQSASAPDALKNELHRRNVHVFDVNLKSAMTDMATVLLEGMRVVLADEKALT